MNKLVIIILLSFLIFSTTARADVYADDSCTPGQSVLSRLLNNATSFGLFSAYSPNFYMSGAGATPDATLCSANYYPTSCSGSSCSGNGVMHDPKSCVPCGSSQCMTSCDPSDPTGCTGGLTCTSTCDPKGSVKVCYQYVSGIDANLNPTYTWDCNWARDGWNKLYLLPPASLQVNKVGDKLCAQFWTLMGYQSIGCKYIPDCSQFATTSSCFVAQACSSAAYQHSKSLIGITGSIMECINASLDLLFASNNCNDGSTTYFTSSFSNFQYAMRKMIKAAITLYFILFGIKMVLGKEMPSRGEFFIFGAKYILVLYFSVGIYTSTARNGSPVYDDGITSYMIPLFKGGAASLANMVYSAGGATGLCSYDPNSYATGYGYLALWDSLDCRLLYYLGIGSISTLAEKIINNPSQAIALTAASLGVPTMLNLIIPALFSFEIIFAVFLIIFFVFLLSIVIYFVNIIVLCTIGLTILIYLSPIFVPMALFQPTKSYFDGWLKLMISYALQPMVVAAYMAMMLTVFDQAVFGNCQFVNKSVNFSIGGIPKTLPFFLLCDPKNPISGCTPVTTDSSATSCENSIGYIVNPLSGNSLTETTSALFFDIVTLKANVVGSMFSSLLTLVLFAFLFYKFAELLGEFAAELTGGTNLGEMAGNPMALVNKAASAAMALAKSATGDKKGAAKDAMQAMQAQNSSGGGGSGANVATTPRGGSGANVTTTPRR